MNSMNRRLEETVLIQFEQYFWEKMRIKETLHSSPLLMKKNNVEPFLETIFEDQRSDSMYNSIFKYFNGAKKRSQQLKEDNLIFRWKQL